MNLSVSNDLYFACIDLTDRPCTVVGAGPVAFEKIEGLLAAGARVHVVAPEATEEIKELAATGKVAWTQRGFESGDLDRVFLVVAATGDRAVSEQVHSAAEQRGLLVNVADVPELCNFILPAVVRDGRIAVAVSTAGASPALAQRLRDEIGRILERPYARLAEILAGLRPWARAALVDYDARKRFFDSIVSDADGVALLEAGEADLNAAIDAAKGRSVQHQT